MYIIYLFRARGQAASQREAVQGFSSCCNKCVLLQFPLQILAEEEIQPGTVALFTRNGSEHIVHRRGCAMMSPQPRAASFTLTPICFHAVRLGTVCPCVLICSVHIPVWFCLKSCFIATSLSFGPWQHFWKVRSFGKLCERWTWKRKCVQVWVCHELCRRSVLLTLPELALRSARTTDHRWDVASGVLSCGDGVSRHWKRHPPVRLGCVHYARDKHEAQMYAVIRVITPCNCFSVTWHQFSTVEMFRSENGPLVCHQNVCFS